ncbi:hypothetical protein LTR85_008192 [Meristemomyces frigidus]|nr:hypothetical protein LTR85_008192 [Meristemomyces frigidus]
MALPHDPYGAYFEVQWMEIPAKELPRNPQCNNCRMFWTDLFAGVKVQTKSSWKFRSELVHRIFWKHYDNECPAVQLEGSAALEWQAKQIAQQKQEEDEEAQRVAKKAAKLAKRRLKQAEEDSEQAGQETPPQKRRRTTRSSAAAAKTAAPKNAANTLTEHIRALKDAGDVAQAAWGLTLSKG